MQCRFSTVPFFNSFITLWTPSFDALIYIVFSLYVPLFGVFQGANHSGVPAVVATEALGVRVLTTYLFRYSSFYAIIWWNGLFGFVTGLLVTWIYYLSGKWQRNSAISES